MRAEIFVGLGQPKSKLYFDLQAMIAEHGGRFRMADILESEMAKSYIPHTYYEQWTKKEIDRLIRYGSLHIVDLMAVLKTHRTQRSVSYMRAKLGLYPIAKRRAKRFL